VTNLHSDDLPAWSQGYGVKAVAGDFDADGDGDIALVGGSGWNTVPVGFSNRNGTFTRKNTAVWLIPAAAQEPGARPFAGDFDADGDADLILAGGQGWNTVAIGRSDRLGGFSVVNPPLSGFPALASQYGAKIAVGDFDGDGDADLATVGGDGWRSVAFALSTRTDSGFIYAQFPQPTLAEMGAQARFALGVRANTDGTADLILTGGTGWNTLPVAMFRP
jgi:hypothetical protein